MTTGRIHSYETFGSVDGPGVRFVVFVQGCGMRCVYCHNPDTWRIQTGRIVSPDEVLERALRYRPYWGEKGGIPVSGGEPLLQMEFVRGDLFSGTVEQYIADAGKKLGGSVKFLTAVRYQTGEGIEKKEENFAAEVAAQMNQGK